MRPLIAGMLSGLSFFLLTEFGVNIVTSAILSMVPTLIVAIWPRPKPVSEVTSRQDGHDKCANCHAPSERFLAGPSGGISTNVACEQCRHEFNIIPTEFPRFILIDELGPLSDERARRVYGMSPLQPQPACPRCGATVARESWSGYWLCSSCDFESEYPHKTPLPDLFWWFAVDGRRAGPYRHSWSAAAVDAVDQGYATRMEDGIKLDPQAEIVQGPRT